MVRTLVNWRIIVPRARSNQYPALSNLESSFSVITHSRSSARALDDAAVNRNRAGYDEAKPAGAATTSIASTHVNVFGGVGMRLLRIYPHGQYSIPRLLPGMAGDRRAAAAEINTTYPLQDATLAAHHMRVRAQSPSWTGD